MEISKKQDDTHEVHKSHKTVSGGYPRSWAEESLRVSKGYQGSVQIQGKGQKMARGWMRMKAVKRLA